MIQDINIGSAPNDGTGDPIRTGFQIVNENFDDVEGSIGDIQDDITQINVDIFTKANDTDVVHKTGSLNESIDGIKTFTQNVILPSATIGSTNVTENMVKLNLMGNSTGLYSFASGGITMASGTQVNIGAVQGFVMDSDNPLNNPTAVSYPGVLNLTPTFLGSAPATYFLITPVGTLLQLNTKPTTTQRRDNIFLGVVGHPAGALTGIGNDPDLCLNFMSQFRAMFEPTRLINEGVFVYANSTNLTLANTAGILYGLGIGFIANGNDSPSTLNIGAGAPMTTQYRTQGTATFPNTTVADPLNYDVAGVQTLIPGSPNQATNQRFYLLQNGMIRIQYGQTIYPTLVDAIAAATNESFVVNVNARNLGILIGIMSIQKGATNLANTAQARFLPVSKFGETVGAAAGIAIGTLQTSYNNSVSPEILTNSILGALTVRRGSAADTDNILEIQNAATTTTASINGNGVITGTSLVRSGGLSTQFLKADGSVDTTTYAINTNVIHTTGNESRTGSLTSDSFIRLGGLSTQYLMADGTTTSTLNTATVVAGTTYTLLSTDHNKQVIFSSATPVTITIPLGLPTGFICEAYQQGVGQLSFITPVGGTLRLMTYELPQSEAQYSIIGIEGIVNMTDTYKLYGQLQSI